ncbi:hypothetical protein [Streptomyces sp. NRRL WC-3742]|uniref:hypothetical protein n=1 Tax=Streptomyces sp. NRRL WC-3742 TaxID=1463934 RepID=UPI00131CCAAB|nr:hypothetical protein [Streptomyces sp. NRRL WC-3742]
MKRVSLPVALVAVVLGAVPASADPAPASDDAATIASKCGEEYGCSYRILPEVSREYAAAVLSVGNAVVNCTGKPIDIERNVVLESSTTDNIAGQISGKAALEGVIDNTTDASASAGVSNKTEVTHIDHTAPTDKGPNQDITNGGTFTIGGTVSGAGQLKLSAKASFELAFQATYSHEWKRSISETTQVKFTVRSGDELQFGVLNAMNRTVGELRVDSIGKLIKNIVVDSPSSVNVSTVVAQTFSAKDHCLSIRPPGRALPDGLVEVPSRTPDAVPTARYRLVGGAWEALG